MTEALVLVAQEGAVRTLTLNRPQSLNSFTSAMHIELAAAFEAAAACERALRGAHWRRARLLRRTGSV
jgi:enoyl-CoA hydratase/carnithine racemase